MTAAPRTNVLTDDDLDIGEVFAERLLARGEYGLLGAHVGGGDARIPLLRDYVVSTSSAAAAARVPWTCHREYPDLVYGMLGNDLAGDCVPAQVYHAVMHLLYGSEGRALDPNVLAKYAVAWYSKLTGYVVGDEATDQGTDPVMAYGDWRTDGVYLGDHRPHHKILGSVQILPHDGVNLRRAIYEFDCAGLSLALPLAWQNAAAWDVGGDFQNDPDWRPGGWGGHQVLGISFTRAGIAVVTWGGVKILTWAGWGTYGQLAQAQVSKDQIGKGGVSETGLDLAVLATDLTAL